MADPDVFKRVFSFKPDLAYDAKSVERIQSNRRRLENELFFDRLLQVLQVDKASQLYPPRSNQDVRNLHHKIVSSAAPGHHKHSLLYYVLLDCRAYGNPAERFAADVYLPEKYATYIEGLWHLDHMQFQTALEKLTQPSLIPTFPEEILYTLVRHAPEGDLALPLAYYHTVAPALTTPKALDALFSAMCQVSITEGFYFARRQDEFMHKHLLHQLVSYVLLQPPGEERAKKGVELVNQPFTEHEEAWFEDYLTTGKDKQLHGARDTIMMRRMATGRFSEALGHPKDPSGRKHDGLNWAMLKDGLKNGMGPRHAPGGSKATSRS
ncbi:MAG: hypothetical protein M1832_003480 [Thelocarpon impressellum]|nr:MAG: hypothetical protein M1832_003480 [Thelocarpon impressellum]